MASTITLTGDWLISMGNRRQVSGTGNLGTYATSGIAVSAAQCGLGVLDSLVIQPAGGYTFEYVPSTGKVKAYRVGVATGTIAVTDGDVTVTGGQSAGPALQITPDSAAGVLGKTAATTRVIPQATLGIAATTATFTGAAAGTLTEVSNAVDISATTFTFVAIGR